MILAALVLAIEGEATPEGAQGLLRRLLKEALPQVGGPEDPFSLALGKGWVRFSFLREEVYARLSPALFGLQGQRVRMGEEVRVLRVLQEGHPWAGVSTYARLFQREEQDLALRFARPTYFRKDGANYPLPEPRPVFSSLIRRFNAFSPVALPGEVAEEILSRTALYDFHGRILPAPGEGKAGGFVGVAAYRLLGGAGEVARYFQALGRFAFYSGVGEGTGLGAGLAKPVASP